LRLQKAQGKILNVKDKYNLEIKDVEKESETLKEELIKKKT